MSSANEDASTMRASIQIGNVIETCEVKAFGRPQDYPEPMLWVQTIARNHVKLARYVLPARLLSGKPLNHNAVTYTFLG